MPPKYECCSSPLRDGGMLPLLEATALLCPDRIPCWYIWRDPCGMLPVSLLPNTIDMACWRFSSSPLSEKALRLPESNVRDVTKLPEVGSRKPFWGAVFTIPFPLTAC